jgi:hypothetical protein
LYFNIVERLSRFLTISFHSVKATHRSRKFSVAGFKEDIHKTKDGKDIGK